MSKKKTKTRIEKELTHHRLEHLEKSPAFTVKSSTSKDEARATSHNQNRSPQEPQIKKDLKATVIIIGSFVALVILLGVLTYQAGLLNPLLSNWGIKY